MLRKYYVRDKNGMIDMEIAEKDGIFTVHYPQYELNHNNVIFPYSCFTMVTRDVLGMILFAYSQEEYEKFCKWYKEELGVEE